MVNFNSSNGSVTILLGKCGNHDEMKAKHQRKEQIIRIATRENLSTSLQNHSPFSLESICIVLNSSDISHLFDPLALAHFVPILNKMNSSISIQICLSSDYDTPDMQIINTAFLLAGLSVTYEKKDVANKTRTLTAMINAKSKSGSAPIQIKTKPKILINKLLLHDLDVDNNDADLFIDEDDLLKQDNNDDNLLAPPLVVDMEQRRKVELDDCGGRKACDNCTCGRAQIEKQEHQQSASTSACGNCGKGDAFRCASCPYLGKPAFKDGEEHLVLDLMDDF